MQAEFEEKQYEQHLNLELLKWGWIFYQKSTPGHVAKSMQLLAELNYRSKELYVKFENVLGDFNLQNKGLLMLCKSQNGLKEEVELAQKAHNLGMKAEVMNSDQLSELDPGITMKVAGGVFFPEDAFFTPELFMNKLHQHLKTIGVELVEGAEANDILIQDRKIKAII